MLLAHVTAFHLTRDNDLGTVYQTKSLSKYPPQEKAVKEKQRFDRGRGEVSRKECQHTSRRDCQDTSPPEGNSSQHYQPCCMRQTSPKEAY